MSVDHDVVWGWIIKGFGGVVTMMSRHWKDAGPPSEGWLTELNRYLAMLDEVPTIECKIVTEESEN